MSAVLAAQRALGVSGVQGSKGTAWRPGCTQELWLTGSHGACKCLSRVSASAPCARAVSQHSRLRSRQRGLEAADSGLDPAAPALSTELTKQIVSLAYGKFRLEIPSWIC